MELILFQKVLASIFIVMVCVLQLFWCLPEGYVMRKIIHRLFYRQVVWCGLDHYWSLFAPDPVSDIFLISFKIDLEDGTSIPWELPEITVKDNVQHLDKTRHVKWCYSLLSQEDETSRKAICEYILCEFLKKGNKGVPAFILIVRHFKPRLWAHLPKMPWLTQTIYSLDVGRYHNDNIVK